MKKKTMLSRFAGRIDHFCYQFRNYFLKRKSRIEYDPAWFRGKRVALIGGADSAYQEKKGEYIDGFDVVVRVNKGVESIAEYGDYVGRRTDFLFHCFFENVQLFGSPITPEIWRESAVKTVVRAADFPANAKSLNSFLNISGNQVRYTEMPEAMIARARSAIKGYHPTTGFLALHSIIEAKPRELFITGITFLKTPHSKFYRNVNLEVVRRMIYSKHNTDLEFDWFCEIYRNAEDREMINPDRRLMELLDVVR